MAFSRRFERLFKRSFGNDIAEVLRAIEDIKPGASPSEETLDLLARFGSFLANIDNAHEQYEDRMKVALRNIEISSDELNAANLELERLNLTINAMLESLGQGLFFFDSSGTCGEVHSRACLQLLEGSPVGRPVSEVLKLDADAEARLCALMDIVFNPSRTAMSFEDLVALAPEWYTHSKGRKISLSYRPMYKNAQDIRAILVIASDVTQEIAVQEAIRAQETRARRILRLVRERQGFLRFTDSLKALAAVLPDSTPAALRHDLHTLKGNARFFYLENIAAALHDLESRMAELPQGTAFNGHSSMAAAAVLETALQESLRAAEEIWGDDFAVAANTASIDLDTLYDIGRRLDQSAPDSPVAKDFWDRLAAVPAQQLVSRLESQIVYFAEREGQAVTVHVDADASLRLLPVRYQTVTDALVHVAKNIATHAPDPPEMRAAAGKPPALQVWINISREPANSSIFRLYIRDDGCGADTGRMRARLMLKAPDTDAIAAMSDDAILQTIFDDDTTSTDKVTETSGRGVGLSALRSAVTELGGQIYAESIAGEGLCLHITLPVFSRLAG